MVMHGNWVPNGPRLDYKDLEEVCPQYAGPPVSGICPGAHEQSPPAMGQIVPLPCGHLVDSKD